jgi:hypothetical protein
VSIGMTAADVPKPCWTIKDDEPQAELVVLEHLVAIHPEKLTLDELIREIEGEEVDFGARDAIHRAVRELSGVGLLHFRGDFLWPTRAALRYSWLQGNAHGG